MSNVCCIVDGISLLSELVKDLILFDGFVKRRCYLKGNGVIVNGISYRITYIFRIKAHNEIVKVGIRFMFLVATLSVFLFGSAMVDNFMRLYLSSFFYYRLLLVIIVLFSIITYLFILSILIRSLGFYSCWLIKINMKKLLLFEEIGGPDMRNDIERLKTNTMI